MGLKDLLQNIFEYENLTYYIAYYEVCYHSGIGKMVIRSGFDVNDMITRLDEMELEVNPENIFIALIDYAKLNFTKEKPYKEIKNSLKRVALMNALNDLIENDKELLNSEFFEAQMLEEITKGSFFDIDKAVERELSSRVEVWREVVTKDLANNISLSVIENYLN